MRQDNAITALHLQVPALDELQEFYQSILGMQAYHANSTEFRFAYSESASQVRFSFGDFAAFVETSNSLYWKIGITLRNLNSAVQFIREQGVEVSTPRQFQDIGYMSHIKDPNGFTIELLQQGFEGNELPVDDGHPIGAQATLAHITLRVADIQVAKQYFGGQLGMRLMSVQAVNDYGFCLYFYAWSDEPLPNPDIESVGNREWLWARPYTFIELQHLQSPSAVIQCCEPGEAGFKGFSYGCVGSEDRFVSSEDIAAP